MKFSSLTLLAAVVPALATNYTLSCDYRMANGEIHDDQVPPALARSYDSLCHNSLNCFNATYPFVEHTLTGLKVVAYCLLCPPNLPSNAIGGCELEVHEQ
ncbi:hypothetical protein E4U53_007708 [Claviceps sorghi]|nr:hypothetical protein E4U53_007708 [Claviceps sorghi]